MLSVIMLSVIMLSVIVLSVIILSVIILSGTMSIVVMLTFVASASKPFQ